MSAFASNYDDLDDIDILGGSYGELIDQDYDHWDYECHHLISKGALKEWGEYIEEKYGENDLTDLLLNDEDQSWGPSIIMEKADHEKTLSYYNPQTRPKWQNDKASKYIRNQADRIIKYGDIIGVIRDETNFIRKNFGHKYERALREVWDYIKSLQFRHPDNATLTMLNPDNFDEVFEFTFGV